MALLRTSASILVALILPLGLFDTVLVSATFFDNSNAKFHDTVTLRDVTPTSHRSRRSAEGMPSHLHFDFDTGNQKVSLRLRRSARMANLPVFTIGDNEALENAHLPKMTDAAVYRDIHRGAAIVAKKIHGIGREFTLQGMLHIGNTPYTISPRGKAKATDQVKAMEHVLHVIKNDETYGIDYVEPDADDGTGYARYRPPIRRLGLGRYRHVRRHKRDSSMPIMNLDGLGDAQKASTPARRNVKVNIVCDYGCYKKFLERHGRNQKLALEEARLYFSYLAQSLDVRFRTISSLIPGVVLTVTPVSIVTATTAKGASFSEESLVDGTEEGINGNTLLPSFRKWVGKNKLPDAATSILQTGYNMMTRGEPEKSGQLGLGYRGGACGRSSVVVVEEKFHGITGMISAHELGHNLGSQHDGSYASGNADCTGDSDRNVMSTYIGVPKGSSKPWTFSKCSAERIVEFITEDKPDCFLDDFEKKIPDNGGQVYDADDQCSITFGKGSYFCRGRQSQAVGFEDMCTKMYCSVPSEDNTCTSIVPIEYTSCGTKKWCVRGKCVHDNRAPPKVRDSCPQGDDPTYRCTQRSCRNPVERNVFCCQTCLSFLRRPQPQPQRLATANSVQTTSPLVLRTQPLFPTTRVLTHRIPTTISTITRALQTATTSSNRPQQIPTPAPTSTANTTPSPVPRRPRICRFSYFYCRVCLSTNNIYNFCGF